MERLRVGPGSKRRRGNSSNNSSLLSLLESPDCSLMTAYSLDDNIWTAKRAELSSFAVAPSSLKAVGKVVVSHAIWVVPEAE